MPRALTSFVAAIALAACTGSSVVDPEADAAPSFAVSPDRPAGGTCTYHSTLLPPEPGQPANVVRRHLDLVCQFLHMGRTIGSADETITVTATGPIVTGSVTYTAANGDQLFVSYNQTGTPPVNGVVTFSGTETVIGGTGRFADASGSLAREGSFAIFTQTGEFETSGTLTY
jgi:hypothetical protein